MNAEDFLVLSEDLVTRDQMDIAALRSAVSRAYYAVFHAARIVQAELGERSIMNHEHIGDRFQQSNTPYLSQLGDRYHSLRYRRNQADYKIDEGQDVEDPATVQAIIQEARALFSEVLAVPNGPHDQEAKASISLVDRVRLGTRS